MITMTRYKASGAALTALLTLAFVGLLAGCGGSEQASASTATQVNGDQHDVDVQPLGDIAEFDGFSIQAYLSPTESLPDAMAQQYGVETDPNFFLLNVVILETETEQQSEPILAEISAHYEDMLGRDISIDMRRIDANNHSSYIGILDTSDQRNFDIVIEAQLENTEQPLRMSFEVQLNSE